MEAIFTGIEDKKKVDRAGRVSIPSSFRARLEQRDPDFPETGKPRVVICYDEADRKNRYLEGMAYLDWQEICARIQAMKYGKSRKYMMDRYIARAQVVPLDETGRIVLKKHAREAYGIDTEVTFTGQLDQFHITAPVVEAAFDEERSRWLDENLGDEDPRSLLYDDEEDEA